MKNIYNILSSILLIGFIAASCLSKAQSFGISYSPEKINYQAIARDGSGNQLLNQNVSVRFSIRQGSAAGPVVYSETQNLMTNQFGLITTFIGTGTIVSGTFSNIDWAGGDRYLQVQIDPAGGSSYTDMGTTQFASVPYSYVANEALFSYDNVWDFTGNDINNRNSGNVGIGTTTPTKKLHVASNTTPNYEGILSVENLNATNSDAYGVVGLSNLSDFYGTGGVFLGGWRGVVGSVIPTGSNNYFGVVGNVFGGTGKNIGVQGSSDQTGVRGVGDGSGVGLTQYYGPSFLETAGVMGEADNSTTSNGFAYGVVGEAFNPASHINCGVFGYASKASTGTNPKNYGVLGICDDVNGGVGILAIHDGTAGSRAMEADVLGGTTQTALFTYIPTVAPANYAGYFSGQIYATNANASIKSFKIDHPQDPENKFLYHSSVESPDMLNVYSGNITTDANGNARILLPSYFEVLNKDFTYQLTCIGTFAQAIVAEKVKDNSFSIQTDKPNVEVSWMVTGIRHDPVAEKYRIIPEVNKTESETGKYLMPEAYGKPASAAMQLPSYSEKGESIHSIRKAKNGMTK